MVSTTHRSLKMLQQSDKTRSWYEDPSTVGAPALAFGAVTAPDPNTDVVAYSSGIPHYTQNAANAFTYTMTLENGSGDMYTSK